MQFIRCWACCHPDFGGPHSSNCQFVALTTRFFTKVLTDHIPQTSFQQLVSKTPSKGCFDDLDCLLAFHRRIRHIHGKSNYFFAKPIPAATQDWVLLLAAAMTMWHC